MRAAPIPGQFFFVFRRVAYGKGDAISFEKPAGQAAEVAAVFGVRDILSALPSVGFLARNRSDIGPLRPES